MLDMLDGTEYFECSCGGLDHTMRLVLDRDLDMDTKGLNPGYQPSPCLYLEAFLPHWNFARRLWQGIRYILGLPPTCGHFATWEIKGQPDIQRIRYLLNELETAIKKGE